MFPRPKTFGKKLFALFVVVVALAQLSTWLIVSRFHLAQARTLIQDELRRAARAFSRVIDERNKLLSAAALTAARDYQIKQLFASDDPATLASALVSIRIASMTDLVSAVSLEGRLITSTSAATASGDIYAQLVARADADPNPNPTAAGYGYLDGQLYSLVLAPVRAPDIIAWLMIGFKIDREFAQGLKDQTGVDLTFFDTDGRLLATTLADTTAGSLTRALPGLRRDVDAATVELDGETALVAGRTLTAGTDKSVTLALQYSLDEKLRPARSAERWLLGVALGALGLSAFISRAFARTLTRPIVALVGHARRIAAGDYTIRNKSYRPDELGRLSEAFDQMSRGLTERDHVRDLLDKNVSPEVAAQLVRDGAALGGEEREVTILFADLRGFTTMSETFSPHDLLTLLNRYLDRMSAEIERQGGVIDKFIGDAIMALFGAPVTQADAADRALKAALAMERALADLNAELAAEGRPPLALGIGINTARVVAGNIGSHRRLNYSVIGDGVNVAARLQSLTRTAEYRTNIITSTSTLAAVRERAPFTFRDLGRVQVKGRAEPVEILALEEPPVPPA
ncbi:adenylate/guanylate cyclase domain-containing protein [Horticoccus sp. 23ND18S-11]|uniref:adenylate/guanylate cyclase domain-containing protein n=1 Tax=Horticoccus sp. 23ND18S-11 TaxID=3391832 RepID=UPI0039C9203D